MWNSFIFFALAAIVFWLGGIYAAYRIKNAATSAVLYNIGTAIIAMFVVLLWVSLERPPMRTLGETRLWYSLFAPLIGAIIYLRWGYKWILSYSTMMAVVFIIINISKPDTHSKALMPALQSLWFIPHVMVYIFSYAILGVASLVALYGIYTRYRQQFEIKLLHVTDNLVYVGFSFLTMGLIFGALWAKESWGHYWTWDPKETWAFTTWLGYLVFIHLRFQHRRKVDAALWSLAVAFLILLICWFGISALPSAQNSVHTYNQ